MASSHGDRFETLYPSPTFSVRSVIARSSTWTQWRDSIVCREHEHKSCPNATGCPWSSSERWSESRCREKDCPKRRTQIFDQPDAITGDDPGCNRVVALGNLLHVVRAW